jgi:hypothetical protein
MGEDKGKVKTGMFLRWMPRTGLSKIYCQDDDRNYTGKACAIPEKGGK